MNYPSAIVVAAGLIAGALALTSTGQSQPPPQPGKYRAVADSAGRVWRVDTSTGGLQRCWEDSNGNILCTRPGMP
jgi:hypothetical protein